MTDKEKAKDRFLNILLVLNIILFLYYVGSCLFLFVDAPQPVTPPSEKTNTIWECDECSFYFIVDDNGASYGEIMLDGKSTYVEILWGKNGRCSIKSLAPLYQGRLFPSTERTTLIGRSKYLASRGVALITVKPRKFPLWEIDEPITLTFACKGEIPKTDIQSGADPISYREITGPLPVSRW